MHAKNCFILSKINGFATQIRLLTPIVELWSLISIAFTKQGLNSITLDAIEFFKIREKELAIFPIKNTLYLIKARFSK